jgi:hypothetical protein
MKTLKIDHPLVQEICQKQNLNYKLIKKHHQRLESYIVSQRPRHFKIQDTCRTDNGYILNLNAFTWLDDIKVSKQIAAFTPAAGASSRYFQALESIIGATFLSPAEAGRILAAIWDEGLSKSALTTEIREIIIELLNSTHPKPDPSMVQKLQLLLKLPKAFQACTSDGLTFMESKVFENKQILPDALQHFYVTPLAFPNLADVPFDLPVNTTLYPQDHELCTIRFSTSGDAIVEDDQLSLVPAGHGALLDLFPKIARDFPGIKGLLIRNIDNVIGSHPDTLSEAQRPILFFEWLYENITAVRKYLRQNQICAANDVAINCCKQLSINIESSSDYAALEALQTKLFHSHLDHSENFSKKSVYTYLKDLYERPINILGQVPNLNNNVGGTPSIVQLNEQPVKLCLEVPHADDSDRKEFLERPEKATHFNPVYVISELTLDLKHYEGVLEEFWLIAHKRHRGTAVLYHESILFELLGNSISSNCVFVEVSNTLFNPHKAILDGNSKSSRDWGF